MNRRISEENSPLLKIEGLSIRRDGVMILKDVDWSVLPGEHWVILGANGSGKTSLLSALTGYFMPSTGRMALLGQEYGRSDWRSLRTRIGIVSSSIRQMMHEEEPALETVASGRWGMIDLWKRVTPTEIREARKLLEQVDCSGLETRPWGVLSQGERQRILIARALMSRPRLLILDEPCAGLDPAAREHFLQFLQKIARSSHSSTPLILVTHHVEEIMPAFTHALVLKDGEVLVSGPVKRVLTSRLLSEAFGAPVKVSRRSSRFALTVGPTKSGML